MFKQHTKLPLKVILSIKHTVNYLLVDTICH